MLLIADWADDLASCRVHIRLFCYGGSLDLLGDAALAKRVSAEKHAWDIAWNACCWIRLRVLGVAKNAVTQVTLNQIVLEILERTSDLRCLGLHKALVIFVAELFSTIFVSIRHHEICDTRFLKQIEET